MTDEEAFEARDGHCFECGHPLWIICPKCNNLLTTEADAVPASPERATTLVQEWRAAVALPAPEALPVIVDIIAIGNRLADALECGDE